MVGRGGGQEAGPGTTEVQCTGVLQWPSHLPTLAASSETCAAQAGKVCKEIVNYLGWLGLPDAIKYTMHRGLTVLSFPTCLLQRPSSLSTTATAWCERQSRHSRSTCLPSHCQHCSASWRSALPAPFWSSWLLMWRSNARSAAAAGVMV